MDPELIKVFASMGVGGVLALVVMRWKRDDDVKYTASLLEVNKRMETRDERMLLIIEANTIALRGLQSAVESVASIKKIEERLNDIERRRERV